MMKIEMTELDGELIVHIEGRLIDAFVPELETCWRRARANQQTLDISLDLKNVTCIDRAGRGLLHAMHSEGVRFLRAGMAIQDILEQIMEQPECKH
jgi:anti-anti-sigma regulatory factor